MTQPLEATGYRVSSRLAALRPAKTVLQASSESFDPQRYAAGGNCQITLQAGMHHEIETVWQSPQEGCLELEQPVNAWYRVAWQGLDLEVVMIRWKSFVGETELRWVIADKPDDARAFFHAVCAWCHEVRGEILAFSGGCWEKSERLFQAVKMADYDGLVLHGTLKQDILRDLEEFLASRALYEEYGVPWKRGILFVGPPGNGKTYCLKALINRLSQPCLYVQSFKSRYESEHAAIQQVFRRARATAPCLLVLEDLDSLITNENRAFFLNELDGFAENQGIITLATTNHPERLDTSILERPSRFDMKYHFELPGLTERRAFLAMWNRRLHQKMQSSPEELEAVAAATEGFSFAYLKELILSSITRWVRGVSTQRLAEVFQTHVQQLRQQMTVEPSLTAAPLVEEEPF